MQKVDAEVRRIIDEQYGLARKLIEENTLTRCTPWPRPFIEWETIDADQIDDIMAGREPRPPKDFTPRTPILWRRIWRCSSGSVEPAPTAA